MGREAGQIIHLLAVEFRLQGDTEGPDVVAHICNSRAQRLRKERWKVQASLGYTRNSRALARERERDRERMSSSLRSLDMCVDNTGLFFQVTCMISLWDSWARGTASQVGYIQQEGLGTAKDVSEVPPSLSPERKMRLFSVVVGVSLPFLAISLSTVGQPCCGRGTEGPASSPSSQPWVLVLSGTVNPSLTQNSS